MCLGAPGFFYCLNLVFLLLYETDRAKIKPNEFLVENDEEITLCFISAAFGGHSAACL